MKKTVLSFLLFFALASFALSADWKLVHRSDDAKVGKSGRIAAGADYYACDLGGSRNDRDFLMLNLSSVPGKYEYSSGMIRFQRPGFKEEQDNFPCSIDVEVDGNYAGCVITKCQIFSKLDEWECIVRLDAAAVKDFSRMLSGGKVAKITMFMSGDDSYSFGMIDCSGFVSDAACFKLGHVFSDGKCLVCKADQCAVEGHSYTNGKCSRCGYADPAIIRMISIKGGSFMMGDGSRSDNKPVEVNVADFMISDVEVTQALYMMVTGFNPSGFKGISLPVEKVTWYDAIEFCNMLSKNEGLEECYSINGLSVSCDFSKNGYRLPTEAEWEYAARCGNEITNDRLSDPDEMDSMAWHSGNSSYRTHEVGTKIANGIGLYDMFGNVREWCWDRYKDSLTGGSNPVGAQHGTYRVLRGGSWFYGVSDCSLFLRGCDYPSYTYDRIGFRLARSKPASES